MISLEKINLLTKQLYPTGRAFKVRAKSWLSQLHYALSLSENKAYLDGISILDSILPDNDNFTSEDATQWEVRLGMIVSNASLSDRKLAIRRKMNHPGTIRARQHYLYLQRELRNAGFDVYVYENKFAIFGVGFITKSPIQLSGSGAIEIQHQDSLQHGDAQHGGIWGDIVANHIDTDLDLTFNVGQNLRSTFFIGGFAFGTFGGQYANIPNVRKDEFRQLILKIKPAQTVGYLFINYV